MAKPSTQFIIGGARASMRTLALTLLAASMIASPSHAQISGLLDSLKNLKATANQLAHGPASTTSNGRPVGANGASGALSGPQASDMVSGTFSTDDALDTQLASSPTVPQNPATFSVVGLKLGMSVKEARRVAVQQHFRPSGWEMGQSFETQARFAAANGMAHPLPSTGAVLAGASPNTADGGSTIVRFEATPDGARIKSVFYKGFTKGEPKEQVYAAMTSRFGKPSDTSPGGNRIIACWGCHMGDSPKGPSLSVNIDGDTGTFIMTLDYGLDEYVQHGKQVAARAAEIRTKAGGSLTF